MLEVEVCIRNGTIVNIVCLRPCPAIMKRRGAHTPRVVTDVSYHATYRQSGEILIVRSHRKGKRAGTLTLIPW